MTDACPNCGYCKHCGRSDKPAPVSVAPIFPRPADETTVDPYSLRYVRPRVWVGGPADPNVTVTWGPPRGAAVTLHADGVYSWQ